MPSDPFSAFALLVLVLAVFGCALYYIIKGAVRSALREHESSKREREAQAAES